MMQPPRRTPEEITHGITSLIVLLLIGWGIYSCNANIEEADKKRQAEEVQRTAQKKLEEKRIAAEERAEDEAYALARDMTYDEYKEAEQIAEELVWFPCRRLVEAEAEWGVNWTSPMFYEWAKNRKTNTIVLWGNDVRIKNAFNADRQASYTCEFNIKTKAITLRKFE